MNFSVEKLDKDTVMLCLLLASRISKCATLKV
jgi:hypothetical protein